MMLYKGANNVTIDGVVIRKTLIQYRKKKRKFVIFVIMYEPKKIISCAKFGSYKYVETFYESFDKKDLVRVTGRLTQSKIETLICVKTLTVLSKRSLNV